MDPHRSDDGETPWLDATQQRVWREWMRATSLIYRYLDEDLHRSGLDLAQYEILVNLSEASGRRLRMNELADMVNFSRSRLTHVVARMERQGRVQRVAAVHDRRGVVAVLTDEGMALIEEAAPQHVRAVRRAFIDVVAPEDLASLRRATSAVIRAAADLAVTQSPTTRAGQTTRAGRDADVPD